MDEIAGEVDRQRRAEIERVSAIDARRAQEKEAKRQNAERIATLTAQFLAWTTRNGVQAERVPVGMLKRLIGWPMGVVTAGEGYQMSHWSYWLTPDSQWFTLHQGRLLGPGSDYAESVAMADVSAEIVQRAIVDHVMRTNCSWP